MFFLRNFCIFFTIFQWFLSCRKKSALTYKLKWENLPPYFANDSGVLRPILFHALQA